MRSLFFSSFLFLGLVWQSYSQPIDSLLKGKNYIKFGGINLVAGFQQSYILTADGTFYTFPLKNNRLTSQKKIPVAEAEKIFAYVNAEGLMQTHMVPADYVYNEYIEIHQNNESHRIQWDPNWNVLPKPVQILSSMLNKLR